VEAKDPDMKSKFSVFCFVLVAILGFGIWYLSISRDQSIRVQDVPHDVQEQPVLDARIPDAPVASYAGECAHNDPKLGGEKFADVRLESHNLETNSYAFAVTNLHTVSIMGVTVGKSSEHRYLALSSRYPEEIVSPSGWTSVAGAGYESPYLVYSWIGNGEANILEGETLSGFILRMPSGFPSDESQYQDLVDADNQPVVPLSLETAPFTVHFNDGSCYWGWVESRP